MGSHRVGHDWTTSLSLSTHKNVVALLHVCVSRFYEPSNHLGGFWFLSPLCCYLNIPDHRSLANLLSLTQLNHHPPYRALPGLQAILTLQQRGREAWDHFCLWTLRYILKDEEVPRESSKKSCHSISVNVYSFDDNSSILLKYSKPFKNVSFPNELPAPYPHPSHSNTLLWASIIVKFKEPYVCVCMH